MYLWWIEKIMILSSLKPLRPWSKFGTDFNDFNDLSHQNIISTEVWTLLSETDSLADTAIFKLAGQVSHETCLSKCFGTVEWPSPSDGRSSSPDENPWAQAGGLGEPGHRVTLISHLIPGLPLHLPGLQQEPKGPIRTGWQDYSLGTLGILSCAATLCRLRILPSSPPRPKV